MFSLGTEISDECFFFFVKYFCSAMSKEVKKLLQKPRQNLVLFLALEVCSFMVTFYCSEYL